jgi:hypothetical protein
MVISQFGFYDLLIQNYDYREHRDHHGQNNSRNNNIWRWRDNSQPTW